MSDKKAVSVFKNGKYLNVAIASAGINSNYQGKIFEGMLSFVKERDDIKISLFSPFSNTTEKRPHDFGEESIFTLIDFDRFDVLVIVSRAMTCEENIKRLVRRAKEKNVPIISIDTKLDDCYNVMVDFADGIRVLTEHIIDVHKCSDIAFVGAIIDDKESDMRLNAYINTLSLRNIEIDENKIFYANYNEDEAYYKVSQQLERDKKPLAKAYVCANDSMAIGVSNALIDNGFSVPGDVIVTGCDGIELAAMNMPAITTINIPFFKAGAQALKMAFDIVCNGLEKNDIVLDNEVVCTESCGCKEISYKSHNKIMKELHNNYLRANFYSKRLIRMTEELSYLNTMEELLDIIQKYMADIYVDFFYLCLCDDYDDYQKRSNQAENYNLTSFTDKIYIAKFKHHNTFEPACVIEKSELLPGYFEGNIYTKMMQFIPIHYQEKVYGYAALSCDGYHGNPFLFNWWLNTVGVSLADTIFKNAFLKNVNILRKLYVEDMLTGLYNRRGFYNKADEFLRRGDMKTVMVLCADMDNLKVINDLYGHQNGDFALTLMGTALKNSSINGNEIVARVGGDEFYIIAPNYNEAMATEFCAKFINNLDSLNGVSKKPFRVAVSYGYIVAAVSENAESIDEFITIADTRMYAQKKARKAQTHTK